MPANEFAQYAKATAGWRRVHEGNARRQTDAWEAVNPARLDRTVSTYKQEGILLIPPLVADPESTH